MVGGVFKQRSQEGVSLPTLIICLVYTKQPGGCKFTNTDNLSCVYILYIHIVSCHNYMYYFLEHVTFDFCSHIML